MKSIKDPQHLTKYANYLLRQRQSYYERLRMRTWQTGDWDYDPFRESDILRDWRQELELFALEEKSWEMFPMKYSTARQEIFTRWNAFCEQNGLSTRHRQAEIPIDNIDARSIHVNRASHS